MTDTSTPSPSDQLLEAMKQEAAARSALTDESVGDGEDFDADEFNRKTAAALSSDMPIISPPDDGAVTLPGGYVAPDGSCHRHAVVRELNGYDEEHILSIRRTSNPMDVMNAYLTRAVQSIGPLKFTPEMCNELLSGDAATLILAIRRATYGRRLHVEGYLCPWCEDEERMKFWVDLVDDIPIKDLVPHDRREFEVPIRWRGKEVMASFRLTTQADNYRAYEMVSKRKEEINTEMLERCLLSIDGQSIADMPELPRDVVRQLGLKARDTLLNAIGDLQPGPQYQEVKVPCPSCGRTFVPTLDMANLLWDA